MRVFVRSPHAFAAIRAIDTAAARAVPGVLAVLTAADLARPGSATSTHHHAGAGRRRMVVPPRPALAGDCVRHVGDPVALVVAETEAAARDGGRAGRGRLRRRASRWPTSPRAVAAGRAAALAARRRAISRSTGTASRADPAARAELERIFAGAAHVARVRLVNQRIVMAPMEPRGALGALRPRAAATRCAAPRRAPSCCASIWRAASACRPSGCGYQRRCRRRLRHAHGRLSRIPGAAGRGEAARAAGALAVEPLGGVPQRQPGARHGHRGGAGARRGRAGFSRSTSTCWPTSAPT